MGQQQGLQKIYVSCLSRMLKLLIIGDEIENLVFAPTFCRYGRMKSRCHLFCTGVKLYQFYVISLNVYTSARWTSGQANN